MIATHTIVHNARMLPGTRRLNAHVQQLVQRLDPEERLIELAIVALELVELEGGGLGYRVALTLSIVDGTILAGHEAPCLQMAMYACLYEARLCLEASYGVHEDPLDFNLCHDVA